jgi:membrane protease YdiL (CAAX protease family)
VENIHLPQSPNANGDLAPWLRPELVAPWWEIAIMVFIVIGQSSLVSTWQAWHGSSRHYVTDLVTNYRMLHTLSIECPILGLLFLYLNRRGWRPEDFRINPTWRSSGQGMLLLPAMAVANSITVLIGFLVLYASQSQYGRFMAYVVSTSPHLMHHSVQVSWLTVVPALVINGFFEEITCMAYAFNQFAAKRGPAFALILTVLLRMSCHTYQGPVHALGIGAVFFVSGLVYWWTRNLWPLILAHILADTISFAVVKFIFG